MNKCAKFHKDSPSDKKAKFDLASAIELSETANCVDNFVLKPYVIEQLRWHIGPMFPLNFYMKFSQKMPLYFFYTFVQKSQKGPKTQMKGDFQLKQKSTCYGHQTFSGCCVMHYLWNDVNKSTPRHF